MDDQTSFVATIPSCVLLDSRLSYGARLLFINLSGLTRQTGYCWAENKYLAEKMAVDGVPVSPRSISRWLSELIESGDVLVETNRDFQGTDRRIWITSGRRELRNVKPDDGSVINGHGSQGGVTDESRGVDSGSASLKEESLKKKSEKERAAPNGAVRPVKSKKDFSPEAMQVVDWLNETTGRRYQAPSKEIIGRLAKGATVEDMKMVVSHRWHLANNDREPDKAKQYVDMNTPFRELHWENYRALAAAWKKPTTERAPGQLGTPREWL